MTSENKETIDEIVAEMRGRAEKRRPYIGDFADAYTYLAARIEAAWKQQEQCYLDQIRDAINMLGHERYKREQGNVKEIDVDWLREFCDGRPCKDCPYIGEDGCCTVDHIFKNDLFKESSR